MKLPSLKWLIPAAGAVGLVAAGAAVVILYLMFVGPRMHDMPHLRTFRREMPAPPAGSVPLEPARAPLPSAGQARALANPLPPTPENLAAGKTWYGYYCGFCHGEPGEYTGPVGESYVPTPPRITTGVIGGKSAGELVRAMLTGPGHEPVLPRAVYPESWWQLELYLHALAATNDAVPLDGFK